MLKETTKREYKGKNIHTHINTLLNHSFIVVLGILLGGASYQGGCVMTGVAYVGALGSGIRGFLGLVGISCGYLASYDISHTALYIGTALFVYTIAFIFQYTPFYQKKWFMPVVVCIFIVLSRSYGSVSITRNSMEDLWKYGLEAITGGCFTYLYAVSLRSAKPHSSDNLYTYSLISILATILTGIPAFRTWGNISLPSVLASVVLMSLIYGKQVQSYPAAIILGAALQYGMTARTGAVAGYTLYSLAEIFGMNKNKLLLTVYVIGMTFVSSFYYVNPNILMWRMVEILFAAFIFLFIPKSFFERETDNGSCDVNEQYRQKAKNIRAFSHFMQRIPDETECCKDSRNTGPDLNFILDCALEEVCGSCEKKSICWEKQRMESISLLQKTTKYVAERGKLEEDDLTNSFKLHCVRSHSFVLAVNYELRRWHLSQRLWDVERTNSQYNRLRNESFGRLLYILSEQLLNYKELPDSCTQRYSVEIGFACKRKSGERVCGDSVRYFKTADGMLYVILSDGVGSGEVAEKYSTYVVSAMESGLKLLGDPISVIELIYYTLHSSEEWSAATIDLLSVNLNTGELSFYKLGASESYVFTAQEAIPIQADSHSVDIPTDAPNIKPIRLKLSADAIIVLTSDGVSINANNSSIQQLLRTPNDMKRTAKQLLLQGDNDISDDKTVITIWVKER